MLWHIELKFCIWLVFFTVLQIKFECRQFPSIFVGVMPLLECRILEIQFSALFSYMLWHIELKFCIWLCLTVLQIKFKCRQFPSIFEGVMPILELRILKIHSFPHFSLTRLDISSWNLVHHFLLLYYRSSLSVVTLRQFLKELCLFGTWNIGIVQFSALFSYVLWHIELKFCIWLCFTVLQIKFECRQFPSIFVGDMPLSECRILKIHSFPHFSLTRLAISSWNLAHHFLLMYYRSSLSVVTLRQFLKELCLFGTWNIGIVQFSALFSYMLWHIELKFCIWLCLTVLQIKFKCRQIPSIFCGSYAHFGT